MLGNDGLHRLLKSRLEGVHDALTIGLTQGDHPAGNRDLIGQPGMQEC